MSTVTTDDALAWLRQQAAAGDMPRHRARLARTAIKRFVSARQDDEPRGARWLLEHTGELTKRLQVEAELTASSLASYRSRVESALDDFLRFSEDADAYQVRRQLALHDDHREARFPLKKNRSFRYRLPADGIDSEDIRRIAAHLWALANDFDPTRPPWG